MEKLKLGIVGMGFISDWHYEGFSSLPDTEIKGMCRDYYGIEEQRVHQKEKLKEKCDKLGINAYDSFEEISKDPEIDALIIGSINPYHFDHINRAVEMGKHVLVEKPVVTDPAQVEKLVDLRKTSGIKIFPAHNFAYRGAVQNAKSLIDAGKLGEIIHSSFVVSHTISKNHSSGWRAVEELGKGGTLIDSGHHLIYQVLYLLGKPSRLHAFTSKKVLTNMDCEDTAQVNLQFPDGSVALIMQSWTSDHAANINGIRILGTKAELLISDALYLDGEKINDDVDYGNSFKNQAQAFRDYLKEDKAPVSDLEDVKNTLEITYGAYRSAKENQVISL